MRALVPALVGVLAGCSGGAVVPDGGARGPDGGADGGRCVGELVDVGIYCAPTFDGTQTNLPKCPPGSGSRQQTVWTCQDLIVLEFTHVATGVVCYYDATSHALVGAQQSSATSSCGGKPISVEAGRTNSMCRENAPLFTRDCTCRGPLATVGSSCQASFDGAQQSLPLCRDANRTIVGWQCQDLLALMVGFGFGGEVCYYDRGSLLLVGAERFDDLPGFCDENSTTIEAGRIDRMCRQGAPTVTRSCSQHTDGGAPTDAGPCVADLASVGLRCPQTYDGTEANLPACRIGGPFSQAVWRCEDLIVYRFFGLGGEACYYDATSHGLVGAEAYSDTPFTNCGATVLSIAAGRTNRACQDDPPLFSRSCTP